MTLKCVLWFFGVLSPPHPGYFFSNKKLKTRLSARMLKSVWIFCMLFWYKRIEYKGNILSFLYAFCIVKCNFTYLCKWIVRIFLILSLFGSEPLLFCRRHTSLSFIKFVLKYWYVICEINHEEFCTVE